MVAAVLAAAAALAPLAIVDRYRRADLTGPRDGPYVLVVCRETLRTARRLSRGEEVALDPSAAPLRLGRLASVGDGPDALVPSRRLGGARPLRDGRGDHARGAGLRAAAGAGAGGRVGRAPRAVAAPDGGRRARSTAGRCTRGRSRPDSGPETIAIPGGRPVPGRQPADALRARRRARRAPAGDRVPPARSDARSPPGPASPAAGVSSVVRPLKALAAVILALTATPLAVRRAVLGEGPGGGPVGRGLGADRGRPELASPHVAVQYEFYVNPERPAIYEVVRYRVTDLGPVRRTRRVIPPPRSCSGTGTAATSGASSACGAGRQDRMRLARDGEGRRRLPARGAGAAVALRRAPPGRAGARRPAG